MPERAVGQSTGLIDSGVGLGPDVVGHDRTAFGVDLGLVDWNAQPSFDQRGVDLEMELEGVDLVAVSERLVRTQCRRGKVSGPPGNLECIAVPLEDAFGRSECREHRVLPPGLGYGDVVPADLLAGGRADMRAEGVRNELRTEADAKDRYVPVQGVVDRFHLRAEVGVLLHLIDVHRAAQDDEPLISVQIRASIGIPPEIHVSNAQPRCFQQWIQCPQDLVGDVLEDQDPAHGLRLSLSGIRPTFMKNGVTHLLSLVGMDRDRAKRALWMAALVVLGFLLRTTNAAEVFFGGAVVFPGNDPYYQVHRVFQALSAYPAIPLVDDRLDHPFGAAPIWPPAFPWLLATLAKALGRSAADPVALERLLALVIPVLGASLCMPVYGLARRILDRPGAWIAASLAVLVPAHLWYSRLGFVDHHAAVTLVQVSMFLAALVAVRGGSVVWLTCALTFGMTLWNGFVLFVGILDVFFALLIAFESDAIRRNLGRLVACAHGAAAILLLPLAAATARATGAPWGAFAVSYLHVGALLAVAGAGLWVWRSPRRAVRGLFLAALAGFGIGLATGALHETVGWVFARDAFMSSIQEVVPIFLRSDGSFDLSTVSIWLTRFWLVIPFLLAALASVEWRRERVDAGRLLLLVWSTALFLLALRQRRFAEAFAPALAILIACGLRGIQAWLIRVGEERGLPNAIARAASAAAVVALFVAGLGPYYERLWRNPTGLLALAEASTDRARSRRVPESHRNLEKLRVIARSAPAGVMNLWPLGHRILHLTGLPVVASPFGSHVGGDSLATSTDFFLAVDEARALQILDERDLRYVVVDNDLGTVGSALISRYGSRAAYYAKTDPGVDGQKIEYLPPLYRTHYGRLALLGGAGLDGVVEPLAHFRLIVDATRDHEAGYPKVFERVEGARVKLRGAPNSSYSFRYEFVSDARRPRTIVFDVQTDSFGRARTTLPYSSERPDLGQSSPWRLHHPKGIREVLVPESAVRDGAAIEVDLRGSILF